jgi:hypothetical protein
MTRPIDIVVVSGWSGPAAAFEGSGCEVVRGDVESGLRRAAGRGHDARLLDRGKVVFPGTIAAVARIASLEPMTGFVAPRGNYGAISSLPRLPAWKDSPAGNGCEAGGWDAAACREAQIAAMRRSVSRPITGPPRAFAGVCLKTAGK